MSREPVAWAAHLDVNGVTKACGFAVSPVQSYVYVIPLYAEPLEVGELVAALQDIAKEECALKSFGLPASVLEETCTCPRHRARHALAQYEDKGGTG